MECEVIEQKQREEYEEDRMRREEELYKMKHKEGRKQQQTNMFLQYAMTGKMTMMGVKLLNNNDDRDNHKSLCVILKYSSI
jgi:hypothetical protein